MASIPFHTYPDSLKREHRPSEEHHMPPAQPPIQPPRHLKHQPVAPEEWDRIRPVFTRMYQDEGMKLKDIMTTLAQEYQFQAPIHMYKRRITQWGLGKSFTSAEKAKYASMAQELLAAGEKLPPKDELGRDIPWDRVRRQEGRKLIPKRVLPKTDERLPDSPPRKRIRVAPDQTFDIADRQDQSSSLVVHKAVQLPSSTLASFVPQLSVSPSNAHGIEPLLRQIGDFYSWYLAVHKEETPLVYLNRIFREYTNIFRRVRSSPLSITPDRRSRAGDVVNRVLRQQVFGLLYQLLTVLEQCLDLLGTDNASLMLHFFANACHQQLGASNPLFVLLKALYDRQKACPRGIDDAELKQLVQCSKAKALFASLAVEQQGILNPDPFHTFKDGRRVKLLDIGSSPATEDH